MKSLVAYAQLVRLPNTFTAMADIFLGAGEGLLLRPLEGVSVLARRVHVALLVGHGVERLFRSRSGSQGASRPAACFGRVYVARRVDARPWGLMVGRLAAGVLGRMCGSKITLGVIGLVVRTVLRGDCLVVAIFLYDGVLKRTLAGPILMGLCRLLNILLGLSILGVWPPFWGWLLALIIGTYIAGVTWFARTEAHRQQQVDADRRRHRHARQPRPGAGGSGRRSGEPVDPFRICRSRRSCSPSCWRYSELSWASRCCDHQAARSDARAAGDQDARFSAWSCSTRSWRARSSAVSACS